MVYYQKYLKYKQKYLDLKQYIGGSIFELDLDNEKDINLQNLEEKLNKLSNIKVTNQLGNFFGIKIKTKNNVYNCIVRFIYDQIIILISMLIKCQPDKGQAQMCPHVYKMLLA